MSWKIEMLDEEIWGEEYYENQEMLDQEILNDVLGVELGITSQPSHSEPDLRLSPHPATG
ncbi:MAG: hypothetical protein GDA48_00445 [Hormoscilla sp. GM102CHS1]|nr:hypothetical protein [Hormoscilla sp. GM102CHS1]